MACHYKGLRLPIFTSRGAAEPPPKRQNANRYQPFCHLYISRTADSYIKGHTVVEKGTKKTRRKRPWQANDKHSFVKNCFTFFEELSSEAKAASRRDQHLLIRSPQASMTLAVLQGSYFYMDELFLNNFSRQDFYQCQAHLSSHSISSFLD